MTSNYYQGVNVHDIMLLIICISLRANPILMNLYESGPIGFSFSTFSSFSSFFSSSSAADSFSFSSVFFGGGSSTPTYKTQSGVKEKKIDEVNWKFSTKKKPHIQRSLHMSSTRKRRRETSWLLTSWCRGFPLLFCRWSVNIPSLWQPGFSSTLGSPRPQILSPWGLPHPLPWLGRPGWFNFFFLKYV